MEHLAVQETVEKWGISRRTVQQLSMGRSIPEAKKIIRTWAYPHRETYGSSSVYLLWRVMAKGHFYGTKIMCKLCGEGPVIGKRREVSVKWASGGEAEGFLTGYGPSAKETRPCSAKYRKRTD